MQINHAPNTSKNRVWVSLEPGRQERSIMTVRGRNTEQGKPRNSVRVCLPYTFPCLSLTFPLKLFLFLSHYFFFNFIFLLSFTFLFRSPDQQWKPRQLTSEERKDNIKLSKWRTLISPHTPLSLKQTITRDINYTREYPVTDEREFSSLLENQCRELNVTDRSDSNHSKEHIHGNTRRFAGLCPLSSISSEPGKKYLQAYRIYAVR